MTRTILILAGSLLLCRVACAQRQAFAVSDSAPSESAALNVDSARPSVAPEPAAPHSISETDLAPEEVPGEAAQGKQPKPLPRPLGESQMPTIQSVKVGYLDSAIIGSQIRVRFDDAFHSLIPDRAEFFYAKCGCYEDLPANDPREEARAGTTPGPGPGNATNLNFQQLYLNVEYAANYRFSLFSEVPMRAIEYRLYGSFPAPSGQQKFTNLIGLSDVSAGVKLAAVASPDRYLTLQLQGNFPDWRRHARNGYASLFCCAGASLLPAPNAVLVH